MKGGPIDINNTPQRAKENLSSKRDRTPVMMTALTDKLFKSPSTDGSGGHLYAYVFGSGGPLVNSYWLLIDPFSQPLAKKWKETSYRDGDLIKCGDPRPKK